jgi:hypothetical protein
MLQEHGVIGALRHRLFVLVWALRALPFIGPAPERNDKLFLGERLEQTKPYERMLDTLFIFATRPCAIA